MAKSTVDAAVGKQSPIAAGSTKNDDKTTFSIDNDCEEKKEAEIGTPVPIISSSAKLAVKPLHHGPVQCDVVLESMDDCVGCLDGVRDQQTFEESLRDQAARQRQIALEHGLSEAEAALIRLQMMDAASTAVDTDGIRNVVENTLTSIHPQLDDFLNVCGHAEDESGLHDLCDGVVQPMDTTLPTSLPGDALVESLQEKSARSLVDVATEDDPVYEFSGPNGPNVHECAICKDSVSIMDDPLGAPSTTLSSSASTSPRKQPTFCCLPCCATDEYDDNFKVCTACILVLTIATNDGVSRVGRCPRCRYWISVSTLHSTSAAMDIFKLDTSGTCQTCFQTKEPLIAEDPAICDACFLSKEVPLSYECEDCHQTQKIHSTLYRSQPSSTSYGHEMWPCNNCQKSTHWRIQTEQLSLIPAGDVPEEWGDDVLRLARMRVHKARQGIAKLDLMGRDEQGKRTKDDGCAVM